MFRKYLLGFILLALVAIAAFMIYQKTHPKKLPPNLVMGVGRFDGDIVNLNTKYPGRIKNIYVQEGDRVQQDTLVAKLDSKEFEAKKEAIEAQIKAKKTELAIAKESLPQNVKKAQDLLEAAKAAKSELMQNIQALQAVVAQDRKDYRRLHRLFEQKLIPSQKSEMARLKLITDQKRLKALKSKLKEIDAKIASAKSTIAQAQSSLKRIEALQNAISALKASLKEVQSMIEDLLIKAPCEGVILDKVAQEGEVIGAGMSVVTMIDPKSLYLKIYVDTIENGKIKLGDKAVIFLDAYPDRAFEAKVTNIAQKAEFTPKEVAVRSDRIQRVYAVKVKPLTPNPLFKLGLPATAVISLDGKGLPKSLQEVPEL